MHVCIDGTALLLPSGGVKNYIYYWLLNLRRLAGDDSIEIFPMIRELIALDHQRSMLGPWSSAARLAFVSVANVRGNHMLDLLGGRIDLFHASNNNIVNPPRNTRLTTTLYDMTCWLLPETHMPANVAATRNFNARVAKHALGFIAISESTRQDAVRILGLPSEAIEVIYPGVADEFFSTTPDMVQQVRDRHGLLRPYILYVGTIEPRKNVDALLDAYEGMRPSLRAEFDLVIAGTAGWAAQSTFDRLAAAPDNVRRLGYVSEAELPALTAGATVLAYPSLYEGFGLPVAQAMAAGVPVITSSVSSLPEVSGEAALLVDPRSVAEIVAALERLLLSRSLRDRLSAIGLQRARGYRWDHCARSSLKFFQRVCGR